MKKTYIESVKMARDYMERQAERKCKSKQELQNEFYVKAEVGEENWQIPVDNEMIVIPPNIEILAEMLGDTVLEDVGHAKVKKAKNSYYEGGGDSISC